MSLVEVPRGRYRREILVAQGYRAVGVALDRYALGILQDAAEKHSPTHLIDERVVAKGLTLLNRGERYHIFAQIHNIHNTKIEK
jgi:tRNA isopentenyl-2-thiomethyl-A-37 hydroxylase MiaE